MKHNIEKNNLNDKVILITGAGDGIGKAVSLECAEGGATIVLLGKTVHKLAKVYDEIKACSAPEPAIYPMDLTGATPHDYKNLSEAIDKEFGKLDGLLNHAGWLGASTPIEQYDNELWHNVLQVNLNAPFLLTQSCLPLLNKSATKSTPASIVFTADQKQSAYWGAYGVAKSGLVTLMKILADELESKNICVNAFDPGPVHTNFRTQAYPAEDQSTLNKPEDVVAPFVYLLSGECDGITGKVFTLDDF